MGGNSGSGGGAAASVPFAGVCFAASGGAYLASGGVDWRQATWSIQYRYWKTRQLGPDQIDKTLFCALSGACVESSAHPGEVILKLATKLGEGVFGAAYKMKVTIQGRKLPDLVFKTGRVNNEEERASLMREAAFWRHIYGEPARISFSTDMWRREWYSLVCQYHPGETFEYYLKEKDLPIEERLKMLDAVLERLIWLYERKQVVHGDLKPDNIIINKPGDGYKAEFADFGLSYRVGEVSDRGPDLRFLIRHLVRWLPEKFPFLRIYRDGRISAADLRVVVQIKVVEGFLFKKGGKENEFNTGIKPENFVNYEALLTWLKSKDSSLCRSLTVEQLKVIPLQDIHITYQRSLLAYCCSDDRSLAVALADSAVALRVAEPSILSSQFKAASDTVLAEAISKARISWLSKYICRSENVTLEAVLMAAEDDAQFERSLRGVAKGELVQVVEKITSAEAVVLRINLEEMPFVHRVRLADKMKELSSVDFLGAVKEEVGIDLSLDESLEMRRQFQQKACHCYERYANNTVRSLSTWLQDNGFEHCELLECCVRFLKGEGRPAEVNLADWQSFAKAVSFSWILVKAYGDYCQKESPDIYYVHQAYMDYVFDQIAYHNLAGLCYQVSERRGWFGHLHKNSFLTQVLEQRDVPWHKEFFAPLFANGLQAVYRERLYLPDKNGEERPGGGFFKPASRVARDQVLAAVKQYVETYSPEAAVARSS